MKSIRWLLTALAVFVRHCKPRLCIEAFWTFFIAPSNPFSPKQAVFSQFSLLSRSKDGLQARRTYQFQVRTRRTRIGWFAKCPIVGWSAPRPVSCWEQDGSRPVRGSAVRHLGVNLQRKSSTSVYIHPKMEIWSTWTWFGRLNIYLILASKCGQILVSLVKGNFSWPCSRHFDRLW